MSDAGDEPLPPSATYLEGQLAALQTEAGQGPGRGHTGGSGLRRDPAGVQDGQ